MSTARMYHGIASDLGCDPELVGVVAREAKLRKKADIVAAVNARLSRDAAKPEAGTDETAKESKPKKAGLTLSQRRALLRLLDADEPIVPASAFKALPFRHLVEVDLADEADGGFTLTDLGVERAESINPGYRDWSAGETVVTDEEGQPVVRDEDGNPIRPKHGTHRAARAEAAAKAAEAEAATTEVATATA